MIDRLFFAAFTFCMLVAGTLAVASAALEGSTTDRVAQAPAVRVVQLPRVVIVGHRPAAETAIATSDATEPAASRAN